MFNWKEKITFKGDSLVCHHYADDYFGDAYLFVYRTAGLQ